MKYILHQGGDKIDQLKIEEGTLMPQTDSFFFFFEDCLVISILLTSPQLFESSETCRS